MPIHLEQTNVWAFDCLAIDKECIASDDVGSINDKNNLLPTM